MVWNSPGSHPDPARDALWSATVARADRCAFFFDFDGTLAPIQDDPEAVQPVPGTATALAALARAVPLVALISARPVHFLRERLPGLPEVAMFGLYGLESQLGTGPVRTHPDAERHQPVMRDLADLAGVELPDQIMVEYKRLSVALHYRTAPQLRAEVERWAAVAAERLGLRAQAGRMVVELKPPGDRDKGSVVTEQTAGLAAAWYFGDDLADLRAFAALDDRHRADPDFLGVRVAVTNSESGDALRPAADLCRDTPEQVPALLAELVKAMPDRG